MSDVERRSGDDPSIRIGSSRMDIAVAHAAGCKRPNGVLQEHISAACAADAAASQVFVSRQSDEIAIPFVVELDARGLSFLADLRSNDRLPPGHWTDARLSDSRCEVHRIGHLMVFAER